MGTLEPHLIIRLNFHLIFDSNITFMSSSSVPALKFKPLKYILLIMHFTKYKRKIKDPR